MSENRGGAVKFIASILLFLLLFAFLLIAFEFAHGETPSVYCQPAVIKAMKTIWAESGDGTTGHEAAFTLSGDPANPGIVVGPVSTTKGDVEIDVAADTFAVFHVHPNDSAPTPSTPENNVDDNGMGDTGVADKYHIDIYVVSSQGLTAYFWREKATLWLRRNLDWQKRKGCQ